MNYLKRTFKETHQADPWILPLSVFLSLTRTSLPFINVYFMRRVIDALHRGFGISELRNLVILILFSNTLLFLLSRSLDALYLKKRQEVHYKFDLDFSKKVMDLDFQHLEDKRIHQKLNQIETARITNYSYTNRFWLYYFHAFCDVFFSVLLAILLLHKLFWGGAKHPLNSPWFILIFLAFLAVYFFAMRRISRWNEKNHQELMDSFIESNNIFRYFYQRLFNYEAGKEIRLYQQQHLINDMEAEKFKGMVTMTKEQGKHEARSLVLSSGLTTMVSLFILLLATAKGLDGLISAGMVLQFVGAINVFMNKSEDLSELLVNYSTNQSHLKQYYEFIDLPSGRYPGSIPVEKRRDREYELEVLNLSFKYPGTSRYVLKNISHKFKLGEKLAIVGENGSGKTTFIKLLMRFYDPDEGIILLNGIDIKKYDYREYMKLFSVVFQDFSLFSFGLGANVAASADYEPSRLEEIFKEVGFYDRYQSLKDQADTYLYKDFDDQGVDISGGEAQKIAMARALYKDSPFLILDEPTAALDPLSEFEIYRRFDAIVEDKTAIYISHRLSSCRFCDNILVFDQGEIIEEGNHETLLALRGKYEKLWNAQAKYYQKEYGNQLQFLEEM